MTPQPKPRKRRSNLVTPQEHHRKCWQRFCYWHKKFSGREPSFSKSTHLYAYRLYVAGRFDGARQ